MTKITSKSLFDFSTFSAPTVHPNGNEIIYVKTTIDEEDNIYISNLFHYAIDTQTTTQWTFGKDQNFAPTWSKDGNQLLFLSTRETKPQAFILEKTGGEARQLTDTETGVSDIMLSPCGNTLFFTASTLDEGAIKKEDPKHDFALVVTEMVYKADGVGFINTDMHKQVFSKNLRTNETTQLTFAKTDHSLSDISPDGTTLLYNRQLIPNDFNCFDVATFELTLATLETIHITKSSNQGAFHSAKYAPNGLHIAFVGSKKFPGTPTQTSLLFYNRETEVLSDVFEAADIYVGDCGVGDFKQKVTTPTLQWLADSSAVYFKTSHYGRIGLRSITPAGTVNIISNELEHIFDYDIDHLNHRLIAAISSPSVPNNIYSIELNTKKRTAITFENDALLAKMALGEYIEVEYKAEDGGIIHGFLVKPSNFDETKKYPLIYNIHGGPHAMHAATFFHEVQTMAAKGFAVLLLNPRGSYGYGQAHVYGVIAHYGEMDYTDLMTGLDGVLADYPFIDAEQLHVTGGSYGGYMTNWIITQTDRFKSAVTQRSITNWTSFAGVSDIGYFFTNWELEADMFDFANLWKFSPIAHVQNVKTPLLILHGEEDHRCPIEQAEQYFTALKLLGVPTRFVRFPKSSHELSRSGIPSLRIQRLTEMLNWIERETHE